MSDSSSESESEVDERVAVKLSMSEEQVAAMWASLGKNVPNYEDEFEDSIVEEANVNFIESAERDLNVKANKTQKAALHCLLRGKNVILVCRSGSGKSRLCELATCALKNKTNMMNGQSIVSLPTSPMLSQRRADCLLPSWSVKDVKIGPTENQEILKDIREGRRSVGFGLPEHWESEEGQVLLQHLAAGGGNNNPNLLGVLDEFVLSLPDTLGMFYFL